MAANADRLSWEEFSATAEKLSAAIAADGAPDVLVGVMRGGMVWAVLVAHQLGVRDVRALTLSHTCAEGVNAPKTVLPVLANPASLGELRGRDVLVADDVAGSGATLAAAQELVSAAGAVRIRTGVCVLNQANWPRRHGSSPPTYIGRSAQRWVIFPWEVP